MLRVILLALGILALVVLALVLAALFAIWYVEYRGLGGLSVVQRAYARLSIYGRWIGLRFADSATPDERCHHLVERLPEIEQPINTITHTYVTERYGIPPEPAQSEKTRSQAAEAWQAARWAFVRHKVALWLSAKREGH